jgi:chromosome segregation ATPase
MSLAALKDRFAEQETSYASATSRLNHRLELLGQTERQTADGQRAVENLTGQVAKTKDRLAAIESDLIDKQTALAQVQVELAGTERTQSQRAAELGRTEQRLSATRTELSQVESQLDHAVLATDVAKLTARQAELTRQVAALDADIERKGPLAESAVAMTQRVSQLQDQIVNLTRDREQAETKLQQAQSDLRLTEADRKLAADEQAKLTGKVSELRGEKTGLEAKLYELGADVRHQDSVYATLEVLKKEQDFLRGLVGNMLDDGKTARQQIDDLRAESTALLTQRLELQKEIAGKQAQVDVLDKAIAAKDQELDAGHGVRNARSF